MKYFLFLVLILATCSSLETDKLQNNKIRIKKLSQLTEQQAQLQIEKATPVGNNVLLPKSYNRLLRPSKLLNGSPADVVNVTLRLRRIINLNMVETSLKIDLIVQTSWMDARLANVVGLKDEPLRVDPKSVWTPGLILTNTADKLNLLFETVTIARGGKVTHLRKGIFTADVHVDVTMYPFDEQKLTLIFDSPGYPQKDVELRVSKQSVHSDVDEVNVFQIIDFKINRVESTSGYYPSKNTYVNFEIKVRRMAGMIVVEIVFPLILILGMAWLSLVVMDQNTAISIATTAFLTESAYIYVVDAHLPKIAYATWLHLFMGIGFCSIFAILCLLLVIDYFDPRLGLFEMKHATPEEKELEKKKRKICCNRCGAEWGVWLKSTSKYFMPALWLFLVVVMSITL